MIRTIAIVGALCFASGMFAMSTSVQACEVVLYAYPRPPLNLSEFPPSQYTVVSGEVVQARLIRTFEPWGEPGGQAWEVTMALDADIHGVPQPTSFEWVINPCGRPLPSPQEGEKFNLLLAREGSGWSVHDSITSKDVRRFVARNAD